MLLFLTHFLKNGPSGRSSQSWSHIVYLHHYQRVDEDKNMLEVK